MASYTLQIQIDREQMMQYMQERYKICFAFGVKAGGRENYNVALTQCTFTRMMNSTLADASIALGPTVMIKWSDQYSIAASNDSFNNGGKLAKDHCASSICSQCQVQFNVSTNTVDITPGQSYTQPESWINGSVNNDSKAPSGGFLFINQTRGAAAVLYRKVNGRNSPIYFSANAPLPQGTEEITPLKKVRVWLASETESGTLVSDPRAEVHEVDFTRRPQAGIRLGADGSWANME